MISYKPFFKTIRKKNITQYELKKIFFVPSSTITRIRNNQSITLSSLDSLCNILNCEIQDIVQITNR